MLSHRLRHRVAVQQKTRSQDEQTGAIVEVWQTLSLSDGTELSVVPAEVLTGQGREFEQAGVIQSEHIARINMRWFEGLRSDMRIVWQSQFWQIKSIETDMTARREYRLRVAAIPPSVDAPSADVCWELNTYDNTPIYWDGTGQ